MSACGYAARREFGRSGVRSKQWATHARDLPLSKPDYYIFPAVGSTVVEFLAAGDHMAADSSLTQRRKDRKVSQFYKFLMQTVIFLFFSEIFLCGEKKHTSESINARDLVNSQVGLNNPAALLRAKQ